MICFCQTILSLAHMISLFVSNSGRLVLTRLLCMRRRTPPPLDFLSFLNTEYSEGKYSLSRILGSSQVSVAITMSGVVLASKFWSWIFLFLRDRQLVMRIFSLFLIGGFCWHVLVGMGDDVALGDPGLVVSETVLELLGVEQSELDSTSYMFSCDTSVKSKRLEAKLGMPHFSHSQ